VPQVQVAAAGRTRLQVHREIRTVQPVPQQGRADPRALPAADHPDALEVEVRLLGVAPGERRAEREEPLPRGADVGLLLARVPRQPHGRALTSGQVHLGLGMGEQEAEVGRLESTAFDRIGEQPACHRVGGERLGEDVHHGLPVVLGRSPHGCVRCIGCHRYTVFATF
jgi:hypothetical protein